MTALSLQSGDFFSMVLSQLAEAYQGESPGLAEADTEDAFSDEALVEAIVKRGSQQHFGTLLARYRQRVHRIALSVLGPSRQAQAEDVCQEVFIKLHQRLDSFRGDCSFSTWLYRLAVNTSIDHQRKSRKFDAIDISEIAEQASTSSTVSSFEASQVSKRVNQALQTLPQTQRMMVYLFYWLGMKVSEIAEVMDCPEGTVKVYMLRARKLLAVQLEDFLNE